MILERSIETHPLQTLSFTLKLEMNDYTFWDDPNVFGSTNSNEPINYSKDDYWNQNPSPKTQSPIDNAPKSIEFPVRDLNRVLITPVGGKTIPDSFNPTNLDALRNNVINASPQAYSTPYGTSKPLNGYQNENAVTKQQILDFEREQALLKRFQIDEARRARETPRQGLEAQFEQLTNPIPNRVQGNWQGWDSQSKLPAYTETELDKIYVDKYRTQEQEVSKRWNDLLRQDEAIKQFRQENPTILNNDQIQRVLNGELPGDVYGPRDLEAERLKARQILNDAANPKPSQGVGVGYSKSTENKLPGSTLPGFGEYDPYKPNTPNNDFKQPKDTKGYADPSRDMPGKMPINEQLDWVERLNRTLQGSQDYGYGNNDNNPKGNGPQAAYDAPSGSQLSKDLKGLRGDLLELPKQVNPIRKPIYDSDGGYSSGNHDNNQKRQSPPRYSPGNPGNIGGDYELPINKNPGSSTQPYRTPIYSPTTPLDLQGAPRNSGRLAALGAVTEGLAYKSALDELNRQQQQEIDLAKKYGISRGELDAIKSAYSPEKDVFNPFDWLAGKQSSRKLGQADGYDIYKDPLGLEAMIQAAKRKMSPQAFRKQFGEDNGRAPGKMPLGPFPQRQSEKEEDEKAKQRWSPQGFDSSLPNAVSNLGKMARKFIPIHGDSANFGDDFRGLTPDEIDKIQKDRWKKHNGIPIRPDNEDRPYDPDKDGVLNPGHESPFPACMSYGVAWSHAENGIRGFIGWIRQPQNQADLYGVDEVYYGIQNNNQYGRYEDYWHQYWNVDYPWFRMPSFIQHFFGFAGTEMKGEVMTIIEDNSDGMVIDVKTVQGVKRRKLMHNKYPNSIRYLIITDNRAPVDPVMPSTPSNPNNPEGEPVSNCRYLPDAKTSVILQSYVEVTGKFKPTPVVLHADMGQFALWISGELQKIHRKIGNVDTYLEASKNVESPIPLNAPMAEMMAMQTFMFGQLPNSDYFKGYATKLAPGKTLAMRQAAQSAIGFSFAGHHQYAGMNLKSNMLDPTSKPAKITTAFDFAVHSFSNLGGMIGLPNSMNVNGSNQSFKNATDGIETANAKVSAIEQDVNSILAMVNAIAKNQEIQNGFLVHNKADVEMLIKDGGFKYKNTIAHVPSLFTQSKADGKFNGNFLERILTPLKNQRIVREWDEKADKLQLGRNTNINSQIAASPYKIEITKDPKDIVIPFMSDKTFKDSNNQTAGLNADKWRTWVDSTTNPPSSLASGVEVPVIKEWIPSSGWVKVPKPTLLSGEGGIKSHSAKKN
jgi:hypothetical protein